MVPARPAKRGRIRQFFGQLAVYAGLAGYFSLLLLFFLLALVGYNVLMALMPI